MNFTFYYLIFQLICIVYGLSLFFYNDFGDNSHFPRLFGINLAEPKKKLPFSIFWCFRDPNDVQMTYYFTGINFWKEQSVGTKEANKRRPEGQDRWVHVARFLGHVGPINLGLVAPMPSVFVSVASSWPKTDYKNSPLKSFAKWRRKNTKPRNRRQKAAAGEDRRGATPPESPPEGSSIPLRSLHQHHRQDQHHLHHHLRDPLHPSHEIVRTLAIV